MSLFYMPLAQAQQNSSFAGLFDSLKQLVTPTTPVVVPAAPLRALVPATVGQGRCIALVIGNGDYQHPDNMSKLVNPTNDAEDIAEALRGFGFEVIQQSAARPFGLPE